MKTLPHDAGLRFRYDAPAFAREILGWTPDPKQREALEHPGNRVVLNWARQCGKSTVCAAKALHTAASYDGSLTLVLGGVESHLGEFFAKVDEFLYGSPTGEDWVGGPVKGQPGKRLARRFPNGSRIVGVTTNRAVRGHSASLLILDEAGYIENAVWDGVLPTLAATSGAIWVVGTPNGSRGWYYDLWSKHANNGRWFKSLYKASDNPRIEAGFLEEMRTTRGSAFMKQEFEGEFLDNGRALLRREDVERLFGMKQ